MAMNVTPLTADFCARITGIDITRPLDEAEFVGLRAAFDRWSVLILPEQPLDDASQIAFSEYFGPLEPTRSVNPAAGTPFARQSNLDIATGAVIPPDDRRMAYQKANMLWHADSTFKAIPSLCSVLSARQVPPVGGATDFASTRAAYEELDDALRARLDQAVVEHDFSYSRALSGFEFTSDEAAQFPPVRHRLVRVNANTGRKSVLIGAHAKLIVGWDGDESRAMLDDLLARAKRHGYSHEWRQGDVVIWDNQAALHRATPYDSIRHRRLMQRTTISSRNEPTASSRDEPTAQ
jgi:alpha-ketoglutarate-dependent 2,4-dichlorophenoxyacetate dioxygenase